MPEKIDQSAENKYPTYTIADIEKIKTENEQLKKLRSIFEQTPGAMFVVDKDFRFEYVNPYFSKMSGYSNEYLLGKTINELFYHGSVPPSRAKISIKLSETETWQGELLTYRKDGSTYWANTNVACYKDSKGNLQGYIVTQQDISDRKNMETALQESEKFYRTLIESSMDAVSLNQDGKFLLVNSAFCNLFGYTNEEVMNMTPEQFIAPEDHERVMSYHYKRMSGEVDKQNYQAKFIHKTGRKILTELSANTIQINGKNASFITLKDITERHRFENDLKKSEQKYRELTEMLPIGVYELDLQGNITYINLAGKKLFNLDEKIEIDPSAMSFFSKSDSDSMKENLKNEIARLRSLDFYAQQEEFAIPVEFMAKNTDGTEFPVLIYLNYIMEESKVSGFRGIIIDISERKNMENALRESEAKYKTLVENSQDGIIIIRDNKILFANNTICKMLGHCIDEIYPASNIVHPDDRYKINAIAERRNNRDFSTINESFRLIHKNGDIRECETSSTLIEFGGEWASFFTVHDVTESNRIQLKLKESEEKYRLLFEAESDAIFMIDTADGQILDANPAASTIYGFSHEELLNMKNTDVSAEPERTKNATENLQTLVPLRYHKKKDGTVFPVELSAGFTKFKDKTIQIVTSRDITERIKAQEALEKSEQKYRELSDFLPQTSYELDTAGNILYMNKSGMIAFGLTEKNYGESLLDSFVPSDREKMQENLKITMEGNRPAPISEYTALHRNGRTFPVMIYGVPVYQNEKLTGTRGMIVDISERKTMEMALQASENKYRTVIEKATDGIVITQKGMLMFANERMCEMVQYSNAELIGTDFLKLVVKEDQQQMIDYHNRRMNGEDFIALYRSRIIRKDGKVITVELNARTSDYNGSPAAFIMIRDITYRIKIENELQSAKIELEKLNNQLEKRVKESSKRLTEAKTQLVNLQKENLQSQFDVLKQQVNPHFLFNSLNVLTSLIKLEPDLAEKFSEQLSKVYRYVLENKDNELVDLQTELNFLDAYIFLLDIRFVGKLKVNINIPQAKRNDKIIPLAMQLLIENAIKHNTMSKSEPLIIDIFVDENNMLNIVNNLQERPSQVASTGVGLKNIQNRYLLLNNTQPVFEKTESTFTAKVPLVMN